MDSSRRPKRTGAETTSGTEGGLKPLPPVSRDMLWRSVPLTEACLPVCLLAYVLRSAESGNALALSMSVRVHSTQSASVLGICEGGGKGMRPGALQLVGFIRFGYSRRVAFYCFYICSPQIKFLQSPALEQSLPFAARTAKDSGKRRAGVCGYR